MEEKKQLFSKVWTENVMKHWNGREDLQALFAGAGDVGFSCLDDKETVQCYIFWDNSGKLTWSETVNDSIPEFVADKAKWVELFTGKISNMSAVITGKIKYSGPQSFLFKYGPRFEHFIRLIQDLDELT